MKRVILIGGKQGVGKGTQSEKLSNEFGIPHIEMGGLLRDYIKRDGRLYNEETISKGILAPENLVLDLLRQNIQNASEAILDGFPRNSAQQVLFEKLIEEMDLQVLRIILDDDDDVCRSRALARGRSDDNVQGLAKRFEIFKNETLPALMLYPGHIVDCRGLSIDEVFNLLKPIFT